MCAVINRYCPRKLAIDLTEWNCSVPVDISKQSATQDISGNCSVHVCIWEYIICSGSYHPFHDRDAVVARRGIVQFPMNSGIETPRSQRCKNRELSFDVPGNIEDAFEERMHVTSNPPMGCSTTIEYCASLIQLYSTRLNAGKSSRSKR